MVGIWLAYGWHNVAEPLTIYRPGSNHLHEGIVGVAGYPGGVGSDVGAGHHGPRAGKGLTAGELDTRNILTLNLRRVAVAASRHPDQVRSILLGTCLCCNAGHRGGERLGCAADEVFHREDDFSLGQLVPHWRQRAQIDDHGRQVLVRHLAVVGVGHHRKQCTTVVSDAFADGPSEHVVRPRAAAGYVIRSEIWRYDSSWKVGIGLNVARTFHARQDRRAGGFPVVGGVAINASRQRGRDVLTSFQALGGGFELTINQGAALGPINGRHPMVKVMPSASDASSATNPSSTPLPSLVICDFP